MRGPEEWPSRGSSPADRIRLTDPAAKFTCEDARWFSTRLLEFSALPSSMPASIGKSTLTQQDDPYERAKKQALALLEQDFHLGGGNRASWEELHERRKC
jgi:hypothetical protein